MLDARYNKKEGPLVMIDYSAHSMREEGNAAHERGAVEEATALFRKLLELYPRSNEAIDAVFYLTSGHRQPLQRVTSYHTSEVSGSASQ